MRVLITGASGTIGGAVVPELIAAGHTVVGLARSDRAAEAIEALGATAQRGTLDDLDLLGSLAAAADGVIHLAFKHDEQNAGNLAGAAADDLRAVQAIGAALTSGSKAFVGTNATGAFAMAGFTGVLTESDTLPGGLRIEAENAVIKLAGQGIRSSVVRLPPTVHGRDRYGFASGLVEVARATGASAYVDNGENRWPSAALADVARLYRLALESAPAGTRLQAVAESGLQLREIAEAVGRRVGVPAISIPASEAADRFGPLSAFVGLDNPASSEQTRASTGWQPEQPGLIADLERSS